MLIMAEQTIDRITLAFSNSELTMSRELRKRAEKRGVNRLIKSIIRRWLEQEPTTKKS